MRPIGGSTAAFARLQQLAESAGHASEVAAAANAPPGYVIERELAEKQLVPLAATALGPQGVAHTQTYLARRTDRALGVAATALRLALHQHASLPQARQRRARNAPRSDPATP